MHIQGLLFINVVSPLHNGSGESLGVVDREIMRERTTKFPIVQSTSIKGVLRDAFAVNLEGAEQGEAKLKALFGPSPQGASAHAGAICFGDAQLLAFPVRSACGGWVWVTSPLVLARFIRFAAIAGLSSPQLQAMTSELRSEQPSAKIPQGTGNAIQFNSRLLLEEYPIEYEPSAALAGLAHFLSEILYPDPADSYFKGAFAAKLVILPDEQFTYFVKQATEVVPNIRIGKNGTTETGSLRYTEYLPSESVLYSLLGFGPRRQTNPDYYAGEDLNQAVQVQELFYRHLPDCVQLGADETTGKGLVSLRYFHQGVAADHEAASEEAPVEGDNGES